MTSTNQPDTQATSGRRREIGIGLSLVEGDTMALMKLQDLKPGQYFRFRGSQTVYEARGKCWYASPDGYDGGPWCDDGELTVSLYECAGCGRNECPGCTPAGQNLSCFL